MNDIPHPAPTHRSRAKSYSELVPPGTPLHIAVAPGLLDQEYVAVRHEGDTDEDYEASKRLLAAVLDYARKG